MTQPPALLWELLVIFALSIAVVFLFQKLRLPVIVGFLATGVIFDALNSCTNLTTFRVVSSIGPLLDSRLAS